MIKLNPPDASIQIFHNGLLICFAESPSNKVINDMAKLDETSGVMIVDRTDDDTIQYMVRLAGLYDPIEAAVAFKDSLNSAGVRTEIRNIPQPSYGYYDSLEADIPAPTPQFRDTYNYLAGRLIHLGHTDAYIDGLLSTLDVPMERIDSDHYGTRLKDRKKTKKAKRTDSKRMSPDTVKKNQKRAAENAVPGMMIVENEEVSADGEVIRRRVKVPVLTSARIDADISASTVKKTQKWSAEEELMRLLRGSLKIMREARIGK
jgi:hypothetical protein